MQPLDKDTGSDHLSSYHLYFAAEEENRFLCSMLTPACAAKADGYATQAVLRTHLKTSAQHFGDAEESSQPKKGFWPVNMKCSYCKEFRCTTQRTLTKHQKEFCGKKPNIPCSVKGCKYWFNEKRTLRTHLRKHETVDDLKEKKKKISVFPCSDCHYKFTSFIAFKAHNGMLPEWALPSPTNRPVISCEERQRRRLSMLERKAASKQEQVQPEEQRSQQESGGEFDNEIALRELQEFLNIGAYEIINADDIQDRAEVAATFDGNQVLLGQPVIVPTIESDNMSIIFATRDP